MTIKLRAPWRALVLVAAVVSVSGLHRAGAPLPACPLRSLTGVPCPACGSTTAGFAVGRLDLGAALAASPAACAGGVVLLLREHAVRTWRLLARPSRIGLAIAGLAAAEVWQLARLGTA